MEFYTNVARYGNTLLYRGYKDGHKFEDRIRFTPTLYQADPAGTAYTMDGIRVSPRLFDTMREVKDYTQQWKDVGGADKKLYGNTNFITQFIQEKFPDNIDFNRDLVNVSTIDIEVASDDGFPEPDQALHVSVGRAVRPRRPMPAATAPEVTTTTRTPSPRTLATWSESVRTCAASRCPFASRSDEEPTFTTTRDGVV